LYGDARNNALRITCMDPEGYGPVQSLHTSRSPLFGGSSTASHGLLLLPTAATAAPGPRRTASVRRVAPAATARGRRAAADAMVAGPARQPSSKATDGRVGCAYSLTTRLC